MYKQIIITALSVLLAWGGNLFAQFRPSPDGGVKLERTIQLIKSLYVDDVDSKKTCRSSNTRNACRARPPHSSYLNEEEVLAMNELTRELQRNRHIVQYAY